VAGGAAKAGQAHASSTAMTIRRKRFMAYSEANATASLDASHR
jgi:hypothetical protein